MKLAVLKILSLLVFLGGVLILCLQFDVQEVRERYENFLDKVSVGEAAAPAAGEEAAAPERNLKIFALFSGVLMTLVGFYAFIPKLPARKDAVTFSGPDGEVTIQLAAVENSLRKVLLKMDEVKKVRISVAPSGDKKRALIRAKVTLVKPAGVSARATTQRVHQFIAHTAKELLGLEELEPIILDAQFALDPKATGQTVRDAVSEPRVDTGAIGLAAAGGAALAVNEALDEEAESFEEEEEAEAEAEAAWENGEEEEGEEETSAEDAEEDIEEVDVDAGADEEEGELPAPVSFEAGEDTPLPAMADEEEREPPMGFMEPVETPATDAPPEDTATAAEEEDTGLPPLAGLFGDGESGFAEEPEAEDLTPTGGEEAEEQVREEKKEDEGGEPYQRLY